MRIRWHGHACFEVGNSVTVVTDPHDGRSIGIRPPSVEADVILISHDHFDHNCSRIVRGNPEVVNEHFKGEKKGVRIESLPTYHDNVRGMKRGENRVYVFLLDGVRFCHLGDLGHELSDEQVRKLGQIDVLFIPVGGVFTLNGKSASRVVKRVEPKVAVPMHYRIGGLSLSLNPVDDFLNEFPEERISRVGNQIDFEKKDIQEELGIWVFTL